MELKAPGRFSEEIRLEVPDRSQRNQILHAIARRMPKATPACLSDISLMTEGQSPAELLLTCQQSLSNQFAELVAGIDLLAPIGLETLADFVIGQGQMAKRRGKKKKDARPKKGGVKTMMSLDPFGALFGDDDDDDDDDFDEALDEQEQDYGDADGFEQLEAEFDRQLRGEERTKKRVRVKKRTSSDAFGSDQPRPASPNAGDPFASPKQQQSGADPFATVPAKPATPVKANQSDPFARPAADPFGRAKEEDPFASTDAPDSAKKRKKVHKSKSQQAEDDSNEPQSPRQADPFAAPAQKADPFAVPPGRQNDPFAAAPAKAPPAAPIADDAPSPKRKIKKRKSGEDEVPAASSPGRSPSQDDPFASFPAANTQKPAEDPFAPKGGKPAAHDDPFAAGPAKSRQAQEDPFAVAPKPKQAQEDPFAVAPKPKPADPFAAAPAKPPPAAAPAASGEAHGKKKKKKSSK
jgi:hypothetical protein